jgi:hypothetical protein
VPTLTRWYLKTALVYFIAALLAGVALQARPALDLPSAIVVLNPVYFHLLMVGWVTQLIFGVVYWMFPRYSKEQPRGNEKLAWATYGLLNVGLFLRVLGEPLVALGQTAWAPLLAASALLQLAAGWAFVANTWGRVKER